MNALARDVFREAQIIGFLEQLCLQIELSDAQYQQAKERYEAVGKWLSDSDDPLLRSLIIYPHGSTALGTAVKPLRDAEHDVDLVARIEQGTLHHSPASLKQLIGQRLRENGRYAPILEEKRRCWRLNYANEFHLDITPSIRNPACALGGELVPDKELRCWKPTNPKGYRSRFEQRAMLRPRVRWVEDHRFEKRADVEPFPQQTSLKGVLRRIVQLSKRHRDLFFNERDADLAPISIILTTLAAWSYERCVLAKEYTSEWDLVTDVVRQMPDFIEVSHEPNRPCWAVWNETTQGENFAEKWNAEPALAATFYTWHEQFVSDLVRLHEGAGLDQLVKIASGAFGHSATQRAMATVTSGVNTARTSGQLSVVPGVGIAAMSAAGSTAVRANTFHGAK
jgi:hypothetical protein